MCWRVLSVCWTGARRSPPPLGASGSEEGLVRIRVSTAQPGARPRQQLNHSLLTHSPIHDSVAFMPYGATGSRQVQYLNKKKIYRLIERFKTT